jgi:hypothetical protein
MLVPSESAVSHMRRIGRLRTSLRCATTVAMGVLGVGCAARVPASSEPPAEAEAEALRLQLRRRVHAVGEPRDRRGASDDEA